MLFLAGGYILDRPLRCIFAYKGATYETLLDELSKEENQDIVDLICVLNRGVIIKKGLILSWDGPDEYSFVSGKAASLGLFYHHLITYATAFIGRSLNLQVYFEPINNWSES
jgi:hypothetical protein